MATRKLSCPSHLQIRKVVPIYFTMIGLFLALLMVSLHGTAPVDSYFPYSVPLDPQGSLRLFWNVTYSEKVVYFQILIKDLKYGIIFGMSDRGEFEGADMAILWSDGLNSFFGVSDFLLSFIGSVGRGIFTDWFADTFSIEHVLKHCPCVPPLMLLKSITCKTLL